MADHESSLYVGCALTNQPRAFEQEIDDVKANIRLLGHRVLDFVGSKAATPGEVYDHDIGHVTACQAMLAIVDHPSLGLGMEIQTAIQLEKPTLAVARIGRQVTRMVLGAAENFPFFEFECYEDLDQVPELFDQFLGRRLLSCYGAGLDGVSRTEDGEYELPGLRQQAAASP